MPDLTQTRLSTQNYRTQNDSAFAFPFPRPAAARGPRWPLPGLLDSGYCDRART
jgi:hypothetical protein